MLRAGMELKEATPTTAEEHPRTTPKTPETDAYQIRPQIRPARDGGFQSGGILAANTPTKTKQAQGELRR
jgi:hypothetical protein